MADFYFKKKLSIVAKHKQTGATVRIGLVAEKESKAGKKFLTFLPSNLPPITMTSETGEVISSENYYFNVWDEENSPFAKKPADEPGF